MNPRELNAEVMAYVALIADIFAEGLARSEAARSPANGCPPGAQRSAGAPRASQRAGSGPSGTLPAALF